VVANLIKDLAWITNLDSSQKTAKVMAGEESEQITLFIMSVGRWRPLANESPPAHHRHEAAPPLEIRWHFAAHRQSSERTVLQQATLFYLPALQAAPGQAV
jgi:hypothetical protein